MAIVTSSVFLLSYSDTLINISPTCLSFLLFSPLHVNPSPVNPFLHEQLYDPSVLLHVAFT